MKWQARVRQANAIVAAAMMLLFMLHGVGNSFEIIGVGMPTSKAIAHTTLTLAVVHAVAGVALTVSDLSNARRSGDGSGKGNDNNKDKTSAAPNHYVGRNARYWAVRASGLAVAVLIALHMVTFLQVGGSAYRLRAFDVPQLVQSLLLVAALAVHILANTRPLMVSLGIPTPHARALDIILVVAALLVLMAAAFVAYYLRWVVV